MKIDRRFLLFFLVAVSVAAIAAVATGQTIYWGCYECEYNNAVTIPRDFCRSVGHEEHGNTKCIEWDFGLQVNCDLAGSPCFNVVVVGGGGGGGGGAGSECIIDPGEFCPTTCMYCDTPLY